MDRAILVTWYDLVDAQKAAHLDWLHGEHLPALAAVNGHAWVAHYEITGGSPEFMERNAKNIDHTTDASIPSGAQFILMIGASSPWTFVHDTASSRPEQRPAAEQARIGERLRGRTAIFIDEERYNGPDASVTTRGGAPGPAIQFGCYSMPNVESEFGLIEFYALRRGPMMARYPGCIGMRKLVAVAGHARHGVLYEFISLDARAQFEAEEYRDHDRKRSSHAATVNRTIHLPGSPSIGRRIWPPVA
jgi:hypothetical protein